MSVVKEYTVAGITMRPGDTLSIARSDMDDVWPLLHIYTMARLYWEVNPETLDRYCTSQDYRNTIEEACTEAQRVFQEHLHMTLAEMFPGLPRQGYVFSPQTRTITIRSPHA